MIYFIAGASGSGKSAIIEDLKSVLPNAVIHDFDDIGVPENADKKWRQEATEQWLQRYLKERDSVDVFCICGQVVLGEVLACPSAKQIDKVNFCLLDVSDFERIQRLKKRNTYGADQNMLNWAAWLRMHHQDPQWGQHVITEDGWKGLDYSRWKNLENWDLFADVTLLDTTDLSIAQVANSVSDVIKTKNSVVQNIIGTPYKIYRGTKTEAHLIDNRLYDWNRETLNSTEKADIEINYVIKNGNNIIAGITSFFYWKILFIDSLFVDEPYRGNDLGSTLICAVEKEAKLMGATLSHLDTYGWQAKDFYLKHGYEIFGVLEDCPPGHKRYYMKKIL